MSDPGLDGVNIQFTIQRVLGKELSVPAPGLGAGAVVVPVLYGAYPDPDKTREVAGVPLRQYVCATWSDLSAGLRGQHTLNLDIITLIGAENDTSGDPYGIRAGRIAEVIVRKFSPPNHAFLVHDYSDPAEPAATSTCLYVINSRNVWGAPEYNKPIPFSETLNRRALRWRFVTKLDMADNNAVYVHR